MIELENKLRQTLDFYLSRMPDDESRDFMIKLILRDCREELLNTVSAFYYGDDLYDPDIMMFYKNLHSDILKELK